MQVERLLLDTNIYGLLARDIQRIKLVESMAKSKSLVIYGNTIIRGELRDIPKKLRHYLAIIFAGLVLASPLPDEIGVPLMVIAYHKLSTKSFAALAFVLHTFTLFIILLVGKWL